MLCCTFKWLEDDIIMLSFPKLCSQDAVAMMGEGVAELPRLTDNRRDIFKRLLQPWTTGAPRYSEKTTTTRRIKKTRPSPQQILPRKQIPNHPFPAPTSPSLTLITQRNQLKTPSSNRGIWGLHFLTTRRIHRKMKILIKL